MPKILPPSKPQEWLGLDRIGLTVHAMKCVYRELTKDDVGIDGEIEVVKPLADGTGYQVTGGIIKFQAKSGRSYVTQDSQHSFASPVSRDDLEYWYGSNFPIAYIIYHPEDDKLYWKEVRSYIKSTPNVFRPPLRITFDKATDEFTVNSYQSLCNFAQVSPRRISLTEQERLFSNLLKVRRLPWVWSAPARIISEDIIVHRLHGEAPPFVVVDGQLFTFSDLTNRKSPLRPFCVVSKAKLFEQIETWWQDEDLKRKYVFMMNRLLGGHLAKSGVQYNKHFKRYYFLLDDGKSPEIKHIWYNARAKQTMPARITAKFYQYGGDRFWRHTAASITFQLIGNAWYLQIIPKYYFTADGFVPFDREKVGKYTTPIKASEKNAHVLNHVLFWADVLSWHGADLETKDVTKIPFEGRGVLIIDKLPLQGLAKFSIPSDPAIYEEPPADQLSFDWFKPLGEDEDDEKEPAEEENQDGDETGVF